MLTVKNTMFGAVVSALFVPFLLLRPTGRDGQDGVLAAWAAMPHLWFLLAHLHVRRCAREGRPTAWPASRSG